MVEERVSKKILKQIESNERLIYKDPYEYSLEGLSDATLKVLQDLMKGKEIPFVQSYLCSVQKTKTIDYKDWIKRRPAVNFSNLPETWSTDLCQHVPPPIVTDDMICDNILKSLKESPLGYSDREYSIVILHMLQEITTTEAVKLSGTVKSGYFKRKKRIKEWMQESKEVRNILGV